jgi:cyclic pyranopterin phosphate synthase
MALTDKFGRQITDLRVSVTDRCNFRCVYCRSAKPENHADDILLEWHEYERLVKILLGMGIRKVRVTGGEPLVRPGVVEFIARLKTLGVSDLSMTTNGHLLSERCKELEAAGLNRINISLDSLDPEKFARITRTQSFSQVIASIDAAQASSLRPVKVNAVLVRGVNDRSWTRDQVVTASEIHRRISARWPLMPVVHERSETARKYRFVDGGGEIGLIAPVSQPFCGHCSRIRITADGKLRTCLFSKEDHDLKPLLRNGAGDREIGDAIQAIVEQKEKSHRINEPDFIPPSRTMVFIGG